MQKSEYEHNKVLVKCALAEETWCMAVEKLDMWKRHKFTLFAKLQSMKNEHKCPFMNSSPLPFDYLSNDVSTPIFSNLAISPCPFCHQGFKPTWDCKIASYRHAYHSWCAIFHFVHQSVCLKVVGKRCTPIGGCSQASKSHVAMRKGKKEVIGLQQLFF